MKTVSLEAFEESSELRAAAGKILNEEDGLVCFPCSGTYRLAADLMSERGVLGLLQAKRRSRHAPALVMVSDTEMIWTLAGQEPPIVPRLIDALWPGNLTIRLPLKRDLPRKVYKELSRPDKKVGVRLPDNPVAELLVSAAGTPLLVSSANISRKGGAESVAAIKKNFSNAVSLFIDAGDLPRLPHSTVLDFDRQGEFKLVREGAVSEETIRQAWDQLQPRE